MKNWGPEVVRQPDGEVVQQSKSSQSSQPSGKLVVCRDSNHEQSLFNEVDIDSRIPGLPHVVVKQAENFRVRDLVQKIENHFHRQVLQADVEQNTVYNPFSAT